jgi:hypothetical protein
LEKVVHALTRKILSLEEEAEKRRKIDTLKSLKSPRSQKY